MLLKSKKVIKYFIYIFWLITFSLLVINYFFINNNIIIKYPNYRVDFWWEFLPNFKNHKDIKDRFDREFNNINIYQLWIYIKNYNKYIPYIEKAIRDKWLSDDLKYVAIIESSLNNNASSNAWAVWLWQFIESTAASKWLIINEFVDERLNYRKSTIAALEYLESLHNRFWNWPLALAAYNRWQTAINNALINQWVDNYFDLELNEETKRYFFKIIATKYALKDFEQKRLFRNFFKSSDIQDKFITVFEIEDLEKWSIESDYDYHKIRKLNPWILKNKLPEWKWEIQIK